MDHYADLPSRILLNDWAHGLDVGEEFLGAFGDLVAFFGRSKSVVREGVGQRVLLNSLNLFLITLLFMGTLLLNTDIDYIKKLKLWMIWMGIQ